MNWSFRLIRIADIDIKIHFTFFFIVLWGAFQWGVPHGMEGALFGMLAILLLFTCVVLHELGHSLAARFFGIPVREIVLLPLGGVALLSRSPSRPLHELVIALAGPLVNLLIVVVLGVGLGLVAVLGAWEVDTLLVPGSTIAPTGVGLLLWLLQANLFLVLFNLIPAFPLDGGRVLRALLAMRFGFGRATQFAAGLGKNLALLFGIYGLLSGNLLLALVAVFIYFSADQEHGVLQARTALSTHRLGDLYNRHALTLTIGDRVSTAVDYMLTGYQPDFAVLQGGRPLGIVTRANVLRALADEPQDLYVQQIMQRDFLRLQADLSVDEAQAEMQAQGATVAAVYTGDAYLGLVSLEDIAEAYQIIRMQQRQKVAAQATLARAS
jgi:Zn-dependent protease